MKPYLFFPLIVYSGYIFAKDELLARTPCSVESIKAIRSYALKQYQENDQSIQSAQKAHQILKKFSQLSCNPEIDSNITENPQLMIQTAWLSNDRVFYFLKGHEPEGIYSEDEECMPILSPFVDDSYSPLSWLPKKLKQALDTTIRQCYGQSQSTEVRWKYWEAKISKAKVFSKQQPCLFDKNAIHLNNTMCVEYRQGSFSKTYNNDKGRGTECNPDKDYFFKKEYCPYIRLVKKQNNTIKIEKLSLPKKSKILDTSNACVVNKVGVNKNGLQFMLAGDGRDCYGGTALFSIEEVYEIHNGKLHLLQDNSIGFK